MLTTHVMPSYDCSRAIRRVPAAVYGAAMFALVLWTTSPMAQILQDATGTTGKGSLKGGIDIFKVVNKLLDPALWIVVGLAPLAIAWGAGAMLFGGRTGPQIMGSAIVAVILVAACKGIAA